MEYMETETISVTTTTATELISGNEKKMSKIKNKKLIKWLLLAIVVIVSSVVIVSLLKSGIIFKNFVTGTIYWQGDWAFACDFHNSDLKSVKTTAALCGPTCDSTADCTHFTWTNYNGGTCWLKKGAASKSDAFYTGDNSMVCGVSDTNDGSNTVLFSVINNCPYTIWPGMDAKSYTPNFQIPNKGGWQLNAYSRTEFYVPKDLYAARIWARTGCKTVNNQFTCDTASCGPWVQCAYDGVERGGTPPATLAEFTLNGNAGQDYYDVSLVDGYNIQMTIRPKNPNDQQGGAYWCTTPSCVKDLNTICPPELQKKNSNGQVVACLSACEKYQTDQYCCRGAYDTPQTCKSTNWPVNYPATFKQACPTAYSYAYDDTTSTYRCSNTGYDIIFC